MAAALLAAIANDTKLLAPMCEHIRRWLPQIDRRLSHSLDRAIGLVAIKVLWLLDSWMSLR